MARGSKKPTDGSPGKAAWRPATRVPWRNATWDLRFSVSWLQNSSSMPLQQKQVPALAGGPGHRMEVRPRGTACRG